MRNCAGDPSGGADLAFPWDASLTQCPMAAYTSDAFELVDSFWRYQRLKILPFGCERVSQAPRWLVEAFEALAAGEELVKTEKAIRLEQEIAAIRQALGVTRVA